MLTRIRSRLATAHGLPWGIRQLLENAGSLVGSNVLTSVLGVPYWWLATQAFSASAVGFAAAAVSAMMLLGTVSMFGLGTLLTGELPRRQYDRSSLLASALTFATVAGLVVGIVFAFAAPSVFGLHTLGGNAAAILLFGVGVALTSMTMVVDQALIGLLRGKLQLWRNAVFSISKLVFLVIVAMIAVREHGLAIYATWVAGLGLSAAWLAVVASTHRHARLGVRPEWTAFRSWRRAAAEHHVLNLALQAPVLTTPLIASALISVAASAYVYTASLVTGFVAYGAIALSMALYAVAARDEASLAPYLRFTLKLALALTALAAFALFVGADLILRIFGAEYSSNAETLLRIFAVGLVLMVIKDHYVAIARIRGTLVGAAALCAAGAALEIGCAAVGAAYNGLTGLAIGIVVALVLEAAVMTPRVVREAGWLGAGRAAVSS